MTYYGYARVSTEHQNDTSIEVQLNYLKQQADSLGMKFAARFEKQSGKNVDDRAVFKSILSNLKSGDVLGIYDNSRLGRNTEENLKTIDFITKCGAMVHCNGRFIDKNSPQDKMMFTIESAFSTYQRDIQLKKSREGMDAKKAKGDWVMRGDLFGYNVYKTKGKTIAEIDEPAAKIIRYIFNSYLEGKSIFQITKSLEDIVVAGHEGMVFTTCFVRRMLLKPIYMGYYTQSKIDWHKVTSISRKAMEDDLVKSNIYPPIISEEIYWRVFEGWRTLKRTHSKQYEYRYSFYEASSLVRCPHCKSRYTHRYRKIGKVVEIYMTTGHDKDCPLKIYQSFRKENLEGLLRATMLLTLSSGTEVGMFFAEKRNEISSTLEEYKAQAESLDAMLEDYKAKKSRIIKAIGDGVFSMGDASATIAEYNEEIAKLEKSKKVVDKSIALHEADLIDIMEVSTDETIQEFIHSSSTFRRTMYKKLMLDAVRDETTMTVEYLNGKKFAITLWSRKAKEPKSVKFEMLFNGESQATGTFDFTTMCVVFDGIEEVDEFRASHNRYLRDLANKVNELLRECEKYSIDDCVDSEE